MVCCFNWNVKFKFKKYWLFNNIVWKNREYRNKVCIVWEYVFNFMFDKLLDNDYLFLVRGFKFVLLFIFFYVK